MTSLDDVPEVGESRASSKGETRVDDEFDLVGLVSFLLRERRAIVGTAVLGSLIALGLGIVLPRKYSSVASFVPQQRGITSSLGNLAAQLGLGAQASEAGFSPAFYADLLRSKKILGDVSVMRFVRPGADSLTLMDVLHARGRTAAEKQETAIERLRGLVTADVGKTGIVTVTARAADARLARDLAQALLNALQTFNVATRQSRAADEARFTKRRLAEAELELREAEDRLQRFLQRNREFRQSPELVFAQDRLARDVIMRQQVYTSLMQAHEQARIEEVRDTPVLTIVEYPRLPVSPDSRHLARNTMLALIGGATIGLLLGLLREFFRGTAALDGVVYAELGALKAAAHADLRSPWQAFVRMLGKR